MSSLYGYENWAFPPEEREYRLAPPQKEKDKPIGYTVADQSVSKGTIEGKPIKQYTDDILPEPKPELPKFKEFNKKLIIKELEKGEALIQKVEQQSTMLRDLMAQEDADDIYGITEIVRDFHSFYKEWAKLKECLNKELELSLPTSKPTV